MTANGAPHVAIVTANANASNSYTLDWLDAFVESPLLAANHVDLLKIGASQSLRKALRDADATVILHSVTADDLRPLRNVVEAFSERRGPICILVGNEINLPWARMSEKIELINQMQVDVIGTQLLLDAGQALYCSLSTSRVVSVPHAVDTDRLVYTAPRPKERVMLGTRSAKYLPILGDVERERFFEAVRKKSAALGWSVDIQNSRLSRTRWQTYLSGIDIAPGTEAGSWYTSPCDELVTKILEDARRTAGGLSIRVDGRARLVARHLPWQVRAWLRRNSNSRLVSNDLDLLGRLDPDETIQKYFDSVERPTTYMKAASSRHFESAALGTAQLLLAGRYNDIFRANEHFIEVQPNHSNLDEAILRIEDLPTRITLAAAARQLVEDGHTFKHRIAAVLEALFPAANDVPGQYSHGGGKGKNS